MESRSVWAERWRLVPAGLVALALLAVASLPGSDLQRVQAAPACLALRFLLSDPVMHTLESGLLAVLVARALRPVSGRWLRLAGATALGYGLLIELYQALLPWRSFGLDDLAWNAVGVLVGLGAMTTTKTPRH
jgi:VanZ family protein